MHQFKVIKISSNKRITHHSNKEVELQDSIDGGQQDLDMLVSQDKRMKMTLDMMLIDLLRINKLLIEAIDNLENMMKGYCNQMGGSNSNSSTTL